QDAADQVVESGNDVPSDVGAGGGGVPPKVTSRTSAGFDRLVGHGSTGELGGLQVPLTRIQLHVFHLGRRSAVNIALRTTPRRRRQARATPSAEWLTRDVPALRPSAGRCRASLEHGL